MARNRPRVIMVVDTMVFAYSLLRVAPFYSVATSAIERADEIVVPDSLHAEFANVLWQWIRDKQVQPHRVPTLLADLRPLITRVVATPALWGEAIGLSLAHDHPVYDTLFVALAIAESTKVITFDGPMLARFPGHTVPADAFVKARKPKGRPTK